MMLTNRTKHIFILFMVVTCLSLSQYANAENNTLVVLSKESKYYNNFKNLLNLKTQNNTNFIFSESNKINPNTHTPDNIHKILIVGTQAIEANATTKINKTLIFSLTPKAYNSYISIHYQETCEIYGCHIINIEQPTQRYFSLARAILPQSQSALIIKHENSISEVIDNIDEPNKKQLKYKVKTVNDKNIAIEINSHIQEHDMLLALPDVSTYNRNTAKEVILSSYHNNKPIIAFSRSFVRAGAITAIFSSLDDIVSETVIHLNNKSKPGISTHYPNNYTIETNESVARSLGINVISEDELRKKIN